MPHHLLVDVPEERTGTAKKRQRAERLHLSIAPRIPPLYTSLNCWETGLPTQRSPDLGIASLALPTILSKTVSQGAWAPWVSTYIAYRDWLAAMNNLFFLAPPKQRFAHVSGRWIFPIALD